MNSSMKGERTTYLSVLSTVTKKKMFILYKVHDSSLNMKHEKFLDENK